MRSYLKYNDSAFLEDLRFKKHKNNENIIPVDWQSSLQKVEIFNTRAVPLILFK